MYRSIDTPDLFSEVSVDFFFQVDVAWRCLLIIQDVLERIWFLPLFESGWRNLVKTSISAGIRCQDPTKRVARAVLSIGRLFSAEAQAGTIWTERRLGNFSLLPFENGLPWFLLFLFWFSSDFSKQHDFLAFTQNPSNLWNVARSGVFTLVLFLQEPA